MKTSLSIVTLAVVFATLSFPCRAQQASVEQLKATAASNAAGIPGRLASEQLKAILAAADEENRRAFSDLVQQTSAVPSALLSIQEGIRQKFPQMGGTDNCRGGISTLQSRLGRSLTPKQIADIEEMNRVLGGCAGQYFEFAPRNSRDITASAHQAVADAKGRQQQIESAKNAILQVEAALNAGDVIRANQLFRGLAGASSQPTFAQSYLQQTQGLRQDLDKQGRGQTEVAQVQSNRNQVGTKQGQRYEIGGAQNPTANSPNKQAGDPTPPQSMIDFVRVGVEGLCQKAPDKSGCVAERVNSEKFKRFQFRILDYSETPIDADYGWLTEFNIDDCEAKASCLVVFTVFLKGTATSTWWFALQYSGNFQSISYASVIDPTGNQTASLKISGHGIDDHIWLFDPKNSVYYDYDAVEEQAAKEEEQREAKQEAQAKAEEQKARAAFRAGPSPEPITVLVEKTYLNTNIASGSPLGLWAEVRISSEDAKRLHDPVGVPKSLAWHLVPEQADGRLRFAIICNPNRKDCFRLSPGKAYSLELMNQYDGAGARGNLDKRFVRVNGNGVYMVADYSSEAN